MQFKPVSPEVTNRLFKPTKLLRELDEFIRSDLSAAELEFAPGEYKSTKSAYGAYHAAARRYKLPVKVRNVGDKVYLVRTTEGGSNETNKRSGPES